MRFFKCKHPNAVYPQRATIRSAGYDVTAVDNGEEWGNCLVYDTGIGVGELPASHYIELVPRSSIFKTDLRLANSIGVIDADYPDTIKVIFDFRTDVAFGDLKKYQKGDRIAQLLVKKYESETNDLDVSKIRTGGFGSTDSKPLKTTKGKKTKKS